MSFLKLGFFCFFFLAICLNIIVSDIFVSYFLSPFLFYSNFVIHFLSLLYSNFLAVCFLKREGKGWSWVDGVGRISEKSREGTIIRIDV